MTYERRIWQTFMRTTKQGSVPSGYYGPETCRWATPEETKQFGLTRCPLVHIGHNGAIDCYFTKTEAVVVEADRMH